VFNQLGEVRLSSVPGFGFSGGSVSDSSRFGDCVRKKVGCTPGFGEEGIVAVCTPSSSMVASA
ncbi:hypothetical protein NDU88_003297, partial [Pleurodeles waltl]